MPTPAAALAYRRPTADLRTHVIGYTGYREQHAPELVRRELPFARVVLIISFGPSIELIESGKPPVLRTSFVAGLQESYGLTRARGLQDGVQVNLSPLGAGAVLGVPMSALANTTVELDDIWGQAGWRLAERLHEAPTWSERFRVLDGELARRLREGCGPSPSVARVWAELHRTAGRARIGPLADDLGWSRKHVWQRFREEVGLPPKDVARILRFSRSVDLLREGERTLTEVAQACGFYDQAHFNREFRRLAGTAPGAFLAGRASNS